MRLERHEGYTLWIDGPVPPGAAAITLRSVVIIRSPYLGDHGLIAHELAHVRQWAELGVVRFLWRYLTSYLGGRLRGYPHWAAYRRIPLECEAEWHSLGHYPPQ